MPTPEEEARLRARAVVDALGAPGGVMGAPSTQPTPPDPGPIATRAPDGTVEQQRPLTPEEVVVPTFLRESARAGGTTADRPSPMMDWAAQVARTTSPTGALMPDQDEMRRLAQQSGVPYDRIVADMVARVAQGENAVDALQAVRDRVGLRAAEGAQRTAEQPLVTGSGDAGGAPSAAAAPRGGDQLVSVPGGPARPADPPVGAPSADRMRAVGALARADAEAGGAGLEDVRKRIVDQGTKLADEVDDLETEYRDREAAAQAGVDEAARRFGQLNASIRAGTIDPDRWWSDRGTGAKILSVFSLLAGGISGIMRRDGRNPVLEQVQEQIRADLDMQERDLGRAERADERRERGAEQLLYHHFRMLQNTQAAKEAAMGTALRQYAAQLQGLAQESTDQVRQTQLAQAADQFLMEAEQADHRARTQLATIEAQRRRRGGGGGGARMGLRLQDGTVLPLTQAQAVQLYAQGKLPGQPNAPGGTGTGADGGPLPERNLVHQRFLAPRVTAVRTGLARVSSIRRRIQEARARGEDPAGVSAAFAVADRLGAGNAADLVTSSEGLALRDDVRDLASQLAKARSGAAMTDNERRTYYNLIAGAGDVDQMLTNLDRVEEELRITGRALYDSDPDQARIARAEWLADFPAGDSSALGGHSFVTIDEEAQRAPAEREE